MAKTTRPIYRRYIWGIWNPRRLCRWLRFIRFLFKLAGIIKATSKNYIGKANEPCFWLKNKIFLHEIIVFRGALNYKRQDVAIGVKELTSGRGVDVVVDTVGMATWPIDLACVRRGGKIVICGVTSGTKAETNLQALYWNQLIIMGSTMGSDSDFREMLSAVTAAKLKPVVDSVFPLVEVSNAMSKMEAGAQFGKIVLKIAE
ncbi:MAG: zinc-binding dehydrogenase [Planctomycetota bacterium]